MSTPDGKTSPSCGPQNWRNLHAGEPAQIRIGIAEEGSGTTTIGVDWPTGADVPVGDMHSWVQRKGEKREPVGVLGWDAALTMYRPLLSYDELSGILEGKPSEFYDQLYRLLGFEQLTKAMDVLDIEVATEALKWLQANAGRLCNDPIAPLAERSREIWAALRQESNVDLGGIRLEGQKTSRRVVLQAAVDGSETEAFGVMSQGELQALALAIFIPRATSPESPFRFLVFDDPIQAMDPSKIDRLLEVLTALAEDRQVIVLTHDDRLPAAIRGSRAPARIVEVTRAANSAISVVESTRPATRLLDDAFAIAADDAVPEDIKRSAIPALCREALEATAWDVYSSKALADGQSREYIECAWDNAAKTAKRLALALAGNADDDLAVDKWKAGGRARRDTLVVVNKAVHQGVSDYKGAVSDARLAVGDLVRCAA